MVLALVIARYLLPGLSNNPAKAGNKACEQRENKGTGEESLQNDVRRRFLSVRH